MNVSAGDIAIIINSQWNSGAIGKVVKFVGNKKFTNSDVEVKDLWEMHFDRPIKVTLLQDNSTFLTHNPLVRDGVLRKIAGPGLVDDVIVKELEHAY